ncbi:phosphoenolpyruvate--protein phosphotransferase [Gordonia sp. 852002-50816_SCH5313054-c]|uniref:phosphoenolpyruvate--protein phosphotransferase n=1 Tax=unclassified Gordonia (in: high G+C Gram-positive bacteria) TaxID=2657482 RepID=UPI0007EA5490|nr:MULTISPECIES: phosphoenolpyruvate--protein phosphotransferase [unclassified Gordonia (in: high G+C Gram-positive bacteria)]OBC17638.1 phosphoenolpyruvate--protein phosphotransferase [Gordonia sp. 852002-50816_SCH5313054-c]OBC18203.1 phosphoenolpyruvate--protein phosphotransferase [Gordonia sp. 852002-50816_SCH5313054-a]
MTGLVVVSHSRALADAAVALASEMLHGSTTRIAVAAGLDAETFGTDATAIVDAIEKADDGQGVVVLMDLGSAVLSAELALELIDPEVRERTMLSAAPLVEGLMAAAVTAASGASPSDVAAEAGQALTPKRSALGVEDLPASGEDMSPGGESAVVEVENPHGLHARPAARLVTEAGQFDAEVTLRNLDTGAGPASARSLSQVAGLAVRCGQHLEIGASGPDAQAAVEHLTALARNRFGEEEAPASSAGRAVPYAGRASTPAGRAAPTAGRACRDHPALPASPGIAIGPVFTPAVVDVEPPDEQFDSADAQSARLRDALDAVRADIESLRATTAQHSPADAAIFDAHLVMLDDPDLVAAALERIESGVPASRAWAEAVAAVENEWRAVDDPYLRERAVDVHAVGQQVLRKLAGIPDATIDGTGVLVVDDLLPAQAAVLDAEKVAGVILAGGSPTSHAAILARARGIPAVVAAGPDVLATEPGVTVALDGSTGEIIVDPDSQTLERLRGEASRAAERGELARASAHESASTADGTRILVAANLGSVEDARAAAESGADGSGLVRTEFLYLDRAQPPSVDEQIDTYLAMADALGGQRITLRTLDVGGDKPLRFAPQPAEENPFLGLRGLRLALAEKTLFDDQLRAIVTVAHQTPISVMFPMVTTVDELLTAREHLDAAITSVGRGEPAGLEVGIMIEVPAAALKTAAFAPHVNFFSIGTNDLTQYTLAAERGNTSVAALADPLDPAVVTLINRVCRGAGPDRLVAVCGELAADETATDLLVALGVRELSVAPRAVPPIKQAVRGIDVTTNPRLVERCLEADTAASVRAALT